MLECANIMVDILYWMSCVCRTEPAILSLLAFTLVAKIHTGTVAPLGTLFTLDPLAGLLSPTCSINKHGLWACV